MRLVVSLLNTNLAEVLIVLLSDRDIRTEIESARVILDPCDLTNLQPSSLDVRLGGDFRFYSSQVKVVDPRLDQDLQMEYVSLGEGEEFVLPAHGFALGCTLERVELPADLAARFEGKSSIGRLGLLPHVAAGFIDPGFSGWITLELHNVTGLPMVLLPGMKVGQLCFFRLSSPAVVPYGRTGLGSHYQGQRGPTTSRFHLSYEP